MVGCVWTREKTSSVSVPRDLLAPPVKVFMCKTNRTACFEPAVQLARKQMINLSSVAVSLTNWNRLIILQYNKVFKNTSISKLDSMQFYTLLFIEGLILGLRLNVRNYFEDFSFKGSCFIGLGINTLQ